MAKKGRRKFRRYLRGAVNADLSGGTLAAKSLSSADFPDVVTETTWVSSVIARWTMDNWTSGDGEGPLLIGLAHSDYTNDEIEEFIENTTSWEVGNLVGQEQAKRKIRMIGTFDNRPATGPDDAIVLNDGKPIRTKCGWMLNTGQTVNLWAYNTGSQTLTTAPRIRGYGHANLWPRG